MFTLVPTRCVGMPWDALSRTCAMFSPRSHALRGNAVPDALRPVLYYFHFYMLTIIRGAARLNYAFPRSAWERVI